LQSSYGGVSQRCATSRGLLASYIALSCLHENRHYASDVIFGAGVGYVVGHTVTRHGKGNFTEFAMYR
jgi:membrane-associated phospholipid phosphatase